MKNAKSKTKLARRLKSLLVMLAMLVALLPLVHLPVAAAGPYTSNESLDAAIDAAIGSTPHAALPLINLRNNENVYGDVNVDDLINEFPGLYFLYLDSTNVTSITATTPEAQAVQVTYTDTFVSGRSFTTPTASNKVVYRESDGVFEVSKLINEIKIQTASGQKGIPAGMLTNGTVTLGSTPYSLAPNGTISQTNMMSNPAGDISAVLNFPIAYAASATLSRTVPMEIKKSGYFLSPATGATVYDGASFDFTLTHIDANGDPAKFLNIGDYDVYLYASVGDDRKPVYDVTIAPDNLSMTITVTASEFGASSVHVQVYIHGATPVPNVLPGSGDDPTPENSLGFLVQAQITKTLNTPVQGIRFVEYNNGTTAGTIYDGGIIHIKGGTTIASENLSKLTSGAYSTTTWYLLEGQITGGVWRYIPERYKAQFDPVALGTPDLAGEIVSVPNPLGGSEKVLALVVTSKLSTPDTYTFSVPGTEPVMVTLNNGAQSPATVSAYLDVNVIENRALGYKIYQIPSIFSAYTKQEIEDAIANGDARIEMVAQYEFGIGEQKDVLLEVSAPGATIVENSTMYLVAAAYYEGGGQSFLMPEPLIRGWYYPETDTLHIFDNIPEYVGSDPATSIVAAQQELPSYPTYATFRSDTSVLQLGTNAYGATYDPEPSGWLVFAPIGDIANFVSFPITKIEAEIIDYIIAPPSLYVSPSLSTGTIYDKLQAEIKEVEALGSAYVPGTYKLYDLNVLCKDTIAIGGQNTYEVWTIYSNYTDSNTYLTSVSSRIDMSDPIVESVPAASNSEFIAKATSNGGSADSLAGNTVEMVYVDTNSGISSKTIELTLVKSAINGLYLVYQDYFGNYYSSADVLLQNFSSEIKPLLADFQIPQGDYSGHESKVYAVFSFGNEDFFEGVSDWRTYIANSNIANLEVTVTPVGGNAEEDGPGGSDTYTYLKAIAASDTPSATISAKWLGIMPTVTFGTGTGAVTYYVGSVSSATENLHVIAPLITGIAANTAGTGTNVAYNATITGYIVGDNWDTDPDVSLAYDTPQLLSGADYTGSVKLVTSNPVDVVYISDYELGFLNQNSDLKIKYEYTYEINGVSVASPITLWDITTQTQFHVPSINVGYPTMDKIYLVAKDPNPNSLNLQWWENKGPLSNNLVYASVNEYTLPFYSGSTVRLYPVALNSRTNLETAFSPPDSISADIVGDPTKDPNGYYNFLSDADFDITGGPWDEIGGLGLSSRFIGTPKVDDDGFIYYEVLFIGSVNYEDYLSFEFDPNNIVPKPLVAGPYSLINAGADTLEIYHLPDKSTAYVADIVATEQTAPPYQAGDKVTFKIEYSLTSSNLGSFEVPASYFDIAGEKDVMPKLPNSPSQADLDANAVSARNALRVESLPGTPAYNFTSEVDPATGESYLHFVPSVAGTYRIKLYTYNNAGILTPNFPPNYYRLVTFNVAPVEQTIYWGQVNALESLNAITNWAFIEESGTSLLDSVALGAGIVKMAENKNGEATVNVKDANDNLLSVIKVTTVSATARTATLSITTAAPQVQVMADGESLGLYWIVTYVPSDTTAVYTINENIVNWKDLFVDGGDKLTISGSMVTASAGDTTSGMPLIYQATYNGTATPTTENFFAQIDTNANIPVYTYAIRNKDNTASVQLPLEIAVGESITLNVAKGVTLVSGIDHVNSDDLARVLPSAYNDSSASFTITGLAVGDDIEITVYPTDGGWVKFLVKVVAATSKVSGTVQNSADGSAIANASVTISDGANTYTATTNASGAFTIPGVPNGTYTLTAKATDYNDYTHQSQLKVIRNDVTGLLIEMNKTASGTYNVSGRVIDNARGTGIVGATINIIGGGKTYTANSGANGDFTISGVPGGASYTLQASANGYSGYLSTVVVSNSDVANLEIRLNESIPGTYDVSGTVTNGISGATVTLGGYTATTTAGGAFIITGVPDGIYTLTVSASGYDTYTSSITVNGANVTGISVTLTASGGGGNTNPPGGGGPSGSTSGGGSANGGVYKITVNATVNGAAYPEVTSAIAGASVKVTVRPSTGYVLKTVTITADDDGSIIPIAKLTDREYTFVMPATDVTVTAVFEPRQPTGGIDIVGPDIGGGEDNGEGKEPAHVCPSDPYTDVDTSLWYHEYIDFVIKNGIMIGTSATTFEPDTRLSRAMMVQILYNMEGKPAAGTEAIFDDVAVGSWYFDAIAWSYENEIVFGYGDGRFGPDDQITREQMVAILYRYAQFKGYDTSFSTSLDGFDDADSVSDWAVPAMKWAIGTGLIIGRDATHIVPKDTATRAEVATIVTRFCKTIVVEVEPSETEDEDEAGEPGEAEDTGESGGDDEAENAAEETDDTGETDETETAEETDTEVTEE